MRRRTGAAGRARRGVRAALVAAMAAVALLTGCAASRSGADAGASAVDGRTGSPAGDPVRVDPAAPRPPAGAFEAVVSAVVDGDTLHATVPGRAGEVKVRLIGVDTPETKRPGTPVQCWGPEASAAMTSLAPPGTRVTAAFQPQGRTDRYGRDLWDVWLPDGRFLQGELVARGDAVARSYPPTTAHAAYLDAVQDAARAAGRGLWSGCPSGEIPRHD